MPDVPFKGLNPYAEADAQFFFGRESLRESIIDNLKVRRLTLFHGESGVGKSSVLRAGVAHALRQETKKNLEKYQTPRSVVVVFPPDPPTSEAANSLNTSYSSWRYEPLTALKQQIEADIQKSITTIQSPKPDLSLVETLKAWTEGFNGQAGCGELFIMLDQFEEYFVYHPQEVEASNFVIEFAQAVNHADLHVNFLISIRSDSLAKLDRVQEYILKVFDNILSIEHLDQDAARDAIVKPIQTYNQQVPPEQTVRYEEQLVDAVLKGISEIEPIGEGKAGLEQLKPLLKNQVAAPYLQLVMTRLWDEMEETNTNCLSLETLTNLADKDDEAKVKNAIEKIVHEHVASIMNSLSESEQEIADRVFQHLVTPLGTKHAYSITELVTWVGCEPTELADLLEKLTTKERRIVRPVGTDRTGAQQYEIFHDILAQAVLMWRKQYQERQQKKEIEQLKMVLGHLIPCMNALSAREQAIVAKSLPYLVMPSGYSVADLAIRVSCNSAELVVLLEKLASGRQRIVRPVGPSPDKPDAQRYAIFHNVLAPAVLEWQRQYLARQQKKKQRGVIALLAGLGIGISVLGLTHYRTEVDRLTDKANQLPLQFEAGQQLVALQGAIQTGKSLQSWVQNFYPLNLFLGRKKDQAIGQTTLGFLYILSGIQEQNQFSLPSGQVVSLSPDWQMFATATDDGTVQVRELQTGAERASLPAAKPVLDLHWDGKTLVMSFADGKIQRWDWQTGKPETLPKLSAQPRDSLRFSRQGETIAIDSGNDTVQVWNWKTDQKLTTVTPSSELLSFTLSPDGQTLATTSADATVQVWNGQTGKQIARFPASGTVRKLDLSPDGKTLATATGDGIVQLWDWQTRKLLTKLPPTGQVLHLSFSPDGKTLATATDEGVVQLWNWQTRKLLTKLPPTGQVLHLSFSPDGKTLATGLEDGTLRLWTLETATGIAQFKPSGPVLGVSFSPDGQRVATASIDNTARLWDTRGKELATLTGHQDMVTSIAFSPDGQRVATGSIDNTARIWDTRGKELATLTGHRATVTSVAFSPDGQRVGTASMDKTARLWDIRGKELATLTGPVTSIAFSPDGQRVATASIDNTARIWDTRGKELATLTGHRGAVTSIAFSPDGQRVATGSIDNTARIWDTNGNPLKPPIWHQDMVTSIAFSPDGQWVATGSRDNTARIWDPDGKLLAKLPGGFSIGFSSDGRQLATASADGVVRIWPLELKDLLALGCQWLEPYLESHLRVGNGNPGWATSTSVVKLRGRDSQTTLRRNGCGQTDPAN